MGHHWREPRPMKPVRKPSVLWEFLGLLLGAFAPRGDNEEWLPFDPSPRSFKSKAKAAEPAKQTT
jgi:hypothetical protein